MRFSSGTIAESRSFGRLSLIRAIKEHILLTRAVKHSFLRIRVKLCLGLNTYLQCNGWLSVNVSRITAL